MILLKYFYSPHYSWWIGCLLAISTTVMPIVFVPAAIAEYQKPKTKSAPDARTTTSTATRGECINNTNNNLRLTAIAPYSHVGQTTSTHPTFTWFVPDSEYFPLEFHLEEYTADSQLKTIHAAELAGKPGIMSLSLPQDLPGLTAGKKYRWKVVMRCTRYKAVVSMAEIEVVAPNSEFETTLNNTSGISKLLDVYSSSGLWYDAFEITLNAANYHQIELQNKLIKELAAVENKSNFSWARQQGEKLNIIGDRLR